MDRWQQAAQEANENPVFTIKEQKELRRKEKALAVATALLMLRKKWEAFCSEDAEG